MQVVLIIQANFDITCIFVFEYSLMVIKQY